MADIISDLPEDILSHILSFLPTKQAVATSVLSKNWKSLSCLVLTLDFDDVNYITHMNDEREKEIYSSFVRSMSAIIQSRDGQQSIQKFRLRCSSSLFSDPKDVRKWIQVVLQSRVEHFHLSLPSFRRPPPDTIIPIINCSTLVVLKLENVRLEPPSNPHFPSLKILHMEHIDFSDHLCLSKFILGCPVLEDLKKKTIMFRSGYSFEYSFYPMINCSTLVVLKLDDIMLRLLPSSHFPSLKMLHMENCYVTDLLYLAKFLSACPALEDLRTNGSYIQNDGEGYHTTTRSYRLIQKEFEMLPKLVRASINRDHVFLLKVITNAKFLQITMMLEDEIDEDKRAKDDRKYVEYINQFYKDCVPIFQNLTHMEVNHRACIDPIYGPGPEWILLHFMRCCLNDYGGLEGELQFASYIMQNAKFLRTMAIYTLASKLEKFKMFQRLSISCSAACKHSFE